MELGGVSLWDEPESLAVLYLTESAMKPTTRRLATLSRLFSGSSITNISVLLSELFDTCEGQPEFLIRPHDGVILELAAR